MESKKPAAMLNEAAREAAARINAVLLAKGVENLNTPVTILPTPPLPQQQQQQKSVTPVATTTIAPSQEFFKEIEINDSSYRMFLTRASTQLQVGDK